MKGYKAFKKGLICDPTGKNPFQFAENTVFEQEEEASICNSGFHFCKNPLDALDFYPLIDDNGEMTEFCEVEALGEVKTNDDKKFCTKKIKIGAKLCLAQFISASLAVTKEQVETEAKEATAKKGKDDLIKSGGNWATLAGGDNATLAGGDGAKLAGGNWATLAGGDNATLAGGDGATLAGGYGATLAGGNWAKLAGGYNATLAGGKHSVMLGDNGSVAKGKKGSLIVLVERAIENNEYIIKSYKAKIVDGEKIKEDTWYKLVDGEFMEVEKKEQ